MTWTRIRTWVGMHPGWAITPVASPCGLVWLVLAFIVMESPVVLSAVQWSLVVGAGAVTLAVAVAWSCIVGCLVGRAGLSLEGAWSSSCKATLIISGLLGVTLGAPTLLFAVGPAFWIPAGIAVGSVAAVFSMAFVFVGLRVANRIVQNRIDRGEWEVIEPVERPKEHR